MTTACVVTDEIKFSDKINMPPQLHSIEPQNDIIEAIANNSEDIFTVTLWDPDAEDGSFYAGEVDVIEQRNFESGTPWEGKCDSPTWTTPDPAQYKGGVMVTIKCNAVFQLKNAPEQTTVLVQVNISDRQFLVSNEDEAKGLQVSWTRELYPENAN